MASSLRPGEITYYEELGVENTASADEIRDAFRALARLLHPDQQSDPQLKDMAERQMRKLNRIHAVLSDAARRTAYDASLESSRNAPIIVFSGSDGKLKKLIARGGAVAAIVFGTFLLLWFMVTGNNTEARMPEAHAASGKTAENPEDAGDQISRLRDQLRAAENERDSALEQLGGRKLADRAALANRNPNKVEISDLTAATDLTDLSQTARSVSTAATPAAAAPAVTSELKAKATQFAGLWVLSKATGGASPGGKSQYPPDFIEVTMVERNGALHGQYHSRYQVLDHAISPDVDFVFNGKPSGSALICAWQGQGGAKGRVTMKLMPASTIEIAWNATELGSQQWLTNGSATLTRK